MTRWRDFSALLSKTDSPESSSCVDVVESWRSQSSPLCCTENVGLLIFQKYKKWELSNEFIGIGKKQQTRTLYSVAMLVPKALMLLIRMYFEASLQRHFRCYVEQSAALTSTADGALRSTPVPSRRVL